MKRNKQTIVGVLLLVCLMALVVVINRMSASIHPTTGPGAKAPPLPPLPKLSVLDANWSAILGVTPAAPRGAADAPYSVVEFGDFECPQCGEMRPIVEKKLDE